MYSDTEVRGVQSIEVGNKLLEALASRKAPMMLKELAAAANMSPAQAHPYLVSFRKLHLVEKVEPGGRYRLGAFALDLGITRMASFDPMRLAESLVVGLSERTGLTGLLSVWGAFGPTVIMVCEGKDQLHMNTRVGTLYSLTGTATGRAFAAHLPADVVHATLSPEVQEIIEDRSVGVAQPLSDEDCHEIRRCGVAAVKMPPVPGIHAIAAPVFDHLGQVLAVVTLVGIARVLPKSADSDHAYRLRNETQLLSRDLGYTGL